jgi:hypothetical protein
MASVADGSIEYETFAERYGHDKTEVLRENAVAEPLCPPQIPNTLVWD